MGLFNRNGDTQRQEMVEEQADRASHQNLQSQGISHALQNQPVLNQQGQLREEYLSRLVDSGLNQESANLLKELLTRDLVLSNLESAEVNEVRWLTRLIQKKVHAMHPPEGSVMQGQYRAFLSDDEGDNLSALDDRQRVLIDQTVMVVVSRVARSKKGWQQEEMSKVYAVSENRKDNEEKGRRIFG